MNNQFSQTIKITNRISAGFFTAMLLLSLQTNVSAASTSEDIFIDADHMRLDIVTGDSIYTGNVKISQGKLLLTGNEITVRQDNNIIKNITVIGKPAQYKNETDDGEPITALSEKMVYDTSQNTLIMTINATLNQPDHRVSSQKIIYDTAKKIIIAGDKNGTDSDTKVNNNRVNITLTPKKQ